MKIHCANWDIISKPKVIRTKNLCVHTGLISQSINRYSNRGNTMQ